MQNQACMARFLYAMMFFHLRLLLLYKEEIRGCGRVENSKFRGTKLESGESFEILTEHIALQRPLLVPRVDGNDKNTVIS